MKYHSLSIITIINLCIFSHLHLHEIWNKTINLLQVSGQIPLTRMSGILWVLNAPIVNDISQLSGKQLDIYKLYGSVISKRVLGANLLSLGMKTGVRCFDSCLIYLCVYIYRQVAALIHQQHICHCRWQLWYTWEIDI